MAIRAQSRANLAERMPLTQARINLGAVVKKVHLDKAAFILEKDGIPVAVLIDVDQYEDYLELQDEKVKTHIKESVRDYRAGRTRLLSELLSGGKPSGKSKGKRKKA